MKAIHKDGRETFFSEITWKTGVPQRYGWQEKGAAELKSLPKAIVDFQMNRCDKKNCDDECKEEAVANVTELNPGVNEVFDVITEKKPKAKKNDNPEPKKRKTGNRKPRTVRKAD